MSTTSNIITVVRTPGRPLGKSFLIRKDGEVVKTVRMPPARALAVQHVVDDVAALQKLLADVSEDTEAAVINSAFPLVPVGETFLLLSENEFKRVGIARHDQSVIWPVENVEGNQTLKALGRFKEHCAPSTWQILDRDVDQHTPSQFADISYDQWLEYVGQLMPGVKQCARLRVHSASSRINRDGLPLANGNGHTWIQLNDAGNLEQLRSVLKARAITLGLAWPKPRLSRLTGEVTGHSVSGIIDWSVFATGRFIFAGKPEVRHEN